MSPAMKEFNYGAMEEAIRQADEVRDILKDNIDKILERDGKLSALDERTEALEEGAKQFAKCSAKLAKKKPFWQNMKMKIIIGVAIVVTTVVIIILAAL